MKLCPTGLHAIFTTVEEVLNTDSTSSSPRWMRGSQHWLHVVFTTVDDRFSTLTACRLHHGGWEVLNTDSMSSSPRWVKGSQPWQHVVFTTMDERFSTLTACRLHHGGWEVLNTDCTRPPPPGSADPPPAVPSLLLLQRCFTFLLRHCFTSIETVGTVRDGHRDPTGTVRDGHRDPTGTVRDGHRDPTGTVRDGHRDPTGTVRDGHRDCTGTVWDESWDPPAFWHSSWTLSVRPSPWQHRAGADGLSSGQSDAPDCPSGAVWRHPESVRHRRGNSHTTLFRLMVVIWPSRQGLMSNPMKKGGLVSHLMNEDSCPTWWTRAGVPPDGRGLVSHLMDEGSCPTWWKRTRVLPSFTPALYLEGRRRSRGRQREANTAAEPADATHKCRCQRQLSKSVRP